MGHLEAYAKYAEKRLQYEQMKEASNQAHHALQAAETELVDAMLDDSVSSWNDTAGANVGMRRSFKIACNEANQQEVEDWLQLVTGDAETYKVTKLDKASVLAYVKGQVEKEELLEDNVPAFLALDSRPIIAVRGWAKKKEEMLRS